MPVTHNQHTKTPTAYDQQAAASATGLRLEHLVTKDAPPQVFDSRNAPTEVVVPLQQNGPYQPAESAIAKALGMSISVVEPSFFPFLIETERQPHSLESAGTAAMPFSHSVRVIYAHVVQRRSPFCSPTAFVLSHFVLPSA